MLAERILILIPHPDDEVVGAAAAIERSKARGAEVMGLYLTTGVPDADTSWSRSRRLHTRRVARRREEAVNAARCMGLETLAFLDHPTRSLRLHLPETRALVREVVADKKPGVVWVPAYEGGHQDHDAANALASSLVSDVPVWEFAEYGRAGGVALKQTFPEGRGRGLELELSPAEAAEKRALLAIYHSERGNLRGIGLERECFRPIPPGRDYTRPAHEGVPHWARFQWVPFRHPRVDFTPPDEVTRDIAAFVATQATETETASKPLSP